ncbi:MAG: sugar phosphate isomerase/epimerase family protein [Anaerolineae bacterium]
MQYGVCADPNYAPALAKAGFEFIELHVQNHLKTTASKEAFHEALAQIKASPLPALAANCFLPGHLKITGPHVDWDGLSEYVATAFERAETAGIQTIVFGSGGARQIPEGFDRDTAWAQLVRFGKMIGPMAEAHAVTVVVEPLNKTNEACNVLTSVGESASYVRDVDHGNVRLLADSYHWKLDHDSYEDLVANAPLLHHVHVATVASRLAPGLEPCDLTDFFQALHIGGYDGPISIEARWDDIESQATQAYAALSELVASVA